MEIKKVDPKLYPHFFPMSLENASQHWFFSLSEKETTTWEDITHAFMIRYKGNTHNTTSQRELEILEQEEKEGFTTYLTRWRGIAAKMVTAPPEKEMVKIFVSNMLPNYKDHLKYLGLGTFDEVYRIGIDIEDDLIKESDKKANMW